MLKQWKSHNLLWNLPRDSEISNCASGPAAWSTPKRRSDSTTFPLGGSAYGPWFWWPFPWWRTFHQPIWVFPKNRVGGKPHYFRFNIQFVGEGESWLCFKTYLRSYFITRVRQDITLVTTPNKRIGETRTITKGLATCQFYSILRVDFPM